MKRALRILRLLVITALLLTAAGLALGYGLLRSERGINWLAQEAATLASDASMQVTIGPITGNALADMQVASITLADAQGPWLTLETLHLVWRPIALLRGEAGIDVLTLEQALLARLPAPTVSDHAGSSSEGELPEIATYLPRELRIGTIAIGEAVSGQAQRLRLHGSGDAARYVLHLVTIEGVETKLDAALVPDLAQFAVGLVLHEAPGGVLGALLGLPPADSIALTAEARRAGDVVTLSTARLEAGGAQLTATGNYALTSDAITLDLAVELADIGIFAGSDLSGAISATATARGTLPALEVTLHGTSPALVASGLLLADTVVDLTGKLDATRIGESDFKANANLTVTTRDAQQNASATLESQIDGEKITVAAYHLTYGDITANGKAEAVLGERIAWTLESAITAPEREATIRFTGQSDAAFTEYESSASGAFTIQGHHFTSTLDARGNAETLTLGSFSLKGPGIDASANGTITLASELVDGTTAINASDLAPLGKLLAYPMEGRAKTDIALSTDGARQNASITAQLRAIAMEALSVKSVDLDLKTADIATAEEINGTLRASDVRLPSGTRVEQLSASAIGNWATSVALKLNGNGRVEGRPWSLAFAGSAAQPEAESYTLKLLTLDGRYGRQPLRLAKAATLTYRNHQAELTPLALTFGRGTISASGRMSEQALRGSINIRQFMLSDIPGMELPEGPINLTLDLRGTPATPSASWKGDSNLTLDDLKFAITTRGEWKDSQLTASADARSGEGKASAAVTLPGSFSLAPFTIGLRETTPLSGSVTANTPLNLFNMLLRPSGQRVHGSVSGSAKLAGTLGAPAFNGSFALSGGTYDHIDSGVCLRNVEARIRGTESAITLERLSATDRDKNTLSGNASLSLTGTQGLSGKLAFDHYGLFCGGLATGNIDGSLQASGTMQKAALRGSLTLGPLRVEIPGNKNAATIPAVPTEWARRSKQKAETPSTVALDIRLTAPNQIFVRGRGLDAEFGGNLTIRGDVTDPTISGQLDKKRGKFILLDRTLELDTASLLFQGPIPPSPFLNVIATSTVSSKQITMTLSGPAAKPSIKLSSTPALPQDELLALLLFGRELAQISPFEAIKLAQATRTLAGESSGPDLLGTVRDRLGLDRLDVGGGDNSNVSVSTGKYITDKVFVGVTQGSSAEEREVTTEINLSPSVSGKTAMDSEGNHRVGLQWKRDY